MGLAAKEHPAKDSEDLRKKATAHRQDSLQGPRPTPPPATASSPPSEAIHQSIIIFFRSDASQASENEPLSTPFPPPCSNM